MTDATRDLFSLPEWLDCRVTGALMEERGVSRWEAMMLVFNRDFHQVPIARMRQRRRAGDVE